MLDISSAFDTIDHNILLSRLHLLGVRDLALSWFTSYLFDSSSSVNIYNSFSYPSPMKDGVPQGSVLGPSLFSIYLYPLPSIISTPILSPSKMNTRALSYIGPKLWNSLPPYIRSIKSYKIFMKYIQQLISGGNLNY